MEQEELLHSLDGKLQVLRDRVQGVVEQYATGLYLWGEGGTSKSYTVEQTLQKLGRPYKLSNSRLTGKGLFQLLRQYPDVVHVLEDVETLLSDKNAHCVLRSALWGQTGKDGLQERLVVWQTAAGRAEVIFTGGIILIANCSLDDLPQLRAMKTRITSLHFQPTNEEIAALMRKIAAEGHRHGNCWLPAGECQEVANEIIQRSKRLERNLDIRLLISTFKDRLQWANGCAETHWLDLLETRMKERVLQLARPGVRAERKEGEFELVRRIATLPPRERVSRWKAATGKSQAAFYRRWQELSAEARQV